MTSLPEPLPDCCVRVPPNVHFEVDDIEENWTYNRKFDYIHSRYLGGAIRDWPKLVRQAYRYARRSCNLSFRSWPRYTLPLTLFAQQWMTFLVPSFTKPGGWVEFQDFTMRFYSNDGTVTEGSALDRWPNEIMVGLKTLGLEPEPGPQLETWVRNAGFKNIHHQVFPFPVGSWPKDKKLVSRLSLIF